MAAAAEVASPQRLLFKEETSSHICRSPFPGLTEPSNNYHTNRNTQTNTSTHQDTTPPSRDAGEKTGGGGGGVGGSAGAAELHLQSGFSLHISCLESVQSCGIHPTPPPQPPCTHIAPAFANLILPLLLLFFLPLHMHTPYSAEHSNSLPPVVSWSSFLSRHTLESCVRVYCVCVCVCVREHC